MIYQLVKTILSDQIHCVILFRELSVLEISRLLFVDLHECIQIKDCFCNCLQCLLVHEEHHKKVREMDHREYLKNSQWVFLKLKCVIVCNVD